MTEYKCLDDDSFSLLSSLCDLVFNTTTSFQLEHQKRDFDFIYVKPWGLYFTDFKGDSLHVDFLAKVWDYLGQDPSLSNYDKADNCVTQGFVLLRSRKSPKVFCAKGYELSPDMQFLKRDLEVLDA